MVDGELWCRFFTLTELFHVDDMLGGYRTHDTNRAKTQFQEVLSEMDLAIKNLKESISSDTTAKANRLYKVKWIFERSPKILKKIITFMNSILFRYSSYKVIIKKNNEWNIENKSFRLNDVTR